MKILRSKVIDIDALKAEREFRKEFKAFSVDEQENLKIAAELVSEIEEIGFICENELFLYKKAKEFLNQSAVI